MSAPLFRVGMTWTWPHHCGGEGNATEVHADSREAAIAEALSRASAGRFGRHCAEIVPEVTSCYLVSP